MFPSFPLKTNRNYFGFCHKRSQSCHCRPVCKCRNTDRSLNPLMACAPLCWSGLFLSHKDLCKSWWHQEIRCCKHGRKRNWNQSTATGRSEDQNFRFYTVPRQKQAVNPCSAGDWPTARVTNKSSFSSTTKRPLPDILITYTWMHIILHGM